MRISDLATETGVSIPTIKFYLREGLVPPGTRTAPNQADYGSEHIHRIRLIRALTEVGGLSVAATLRVLVAADDPTLQVHEVFGVAHRGLGRSSLQSEGAADLEEASAEVDRYLDRLGWRLKPDAPARADLAHALQVLRHLGWDVSADVFDPYVRLADEIARWEIDQLPTDAPRARAIESVVVGTVVFEVVLNALRRLAQEHHSADRFASDT
ncbi:MerR family transcriptional regulator [soil metagenome]